MKTYQQYLDIIYKRESDDFRRHKEHPLGWLVEKPGRTMQEISIEIMGMMMQDFLNELADLTRSK